MLGLAISVGATSLLLPRQGDGVLAAEPPVAANQKPEASSKSYIVQPGDTLAQIALNHSANLDALLELNGIGESDLLQVGQTLQIPAKPASKPHLNADVAELPSDNESALASKPTNLEKINPKPSISLLNGKEELHQEQAASSTGSSIDRVSLRSTSNAVKTVPSLPDTVVVRPQDDSIPVIDASQGQTATNLDPETSQASDEPLAVIAPTHDGSLSSAKDEAITAIRDSSSAIEESLTSPLSPPLRESQGVALSISEVSESVELASVESPTVAAPRQYQVQAGDTLGQVAQRYGVSMRALADANALNNPHMIRAGQVLVVPSIMGANLAAYAASGANSRASTPASAVDGNRTLVADSSTMIQPQGSNFETPPSADTSSSQSVSGRRTAPNPYIAGLQAEIRALQQKYEGRLSSVLRNGPTALNSSQQFEDTNSQAAVVSPSTAAVLEDSTSEATAATRSVTEAGAASVGSLPPLHGETDAEAVVREAQQVALASPSPDDSNPAVRSLLGQTVSPSLPPLASADAYLPENMRFNGYVWPTRGVFTSGYGWRWGRMHKGIDIAAPIGTPIVAAADGEVVFAGWNSGGYGNLVDIRHADGSLTRYAHNSRVLVKRGQKVRQGQL
ncbi:MAG: LysM peptidoglycan-binding domain-containing protein, partial [Cyanophyceae cyanobacterium]